MSDMFDIETRIDVLVLVMSLCETTSSNVTGRYFSTLRNIFKYSKSKHAYYDSPWQILNIVRVRVLNGLSLPFVFSVSSRPRYWRISGHFLHNLK